MTHKVANALMRAHGYNRRLPEDKMEFDQTNPNSQYAMSYEDAKVAVETFVGTLMDLETEELEEKDEDQEHTVEDYELLTIPERTAVKSSAATFIFLETPVGEPMYISDVREWLTAIDNAGYPDDLEVEGFLHTSRDYDTNYVDKIECGDCGTTDTVLITHECEEVKNTHPKLF